MRKFLLMICIIIFSNSSASAACGCTDFQIADDELKKLIENYAKEDKKLAQSLSLLGEESIKSGYQSMGNSAIDLEYILRLKKEGALIEKEIVFERDKKSKLISNMNMVEAKNAAIDLSKAEKSSILKSITANK